MIAAAQGSIIGPDLWDVTYDAPLRIVLDDEMHMVGYADEGAPLIATKTVELAQLKLNQVMRTVNDWMEEHSLSLV